MRLKTRNTKKLCFYYFPSCFSFFSLFASLFIYSFTPFPPASQLGRGQEQAWWVRLLFRPKAMGVQYISLLLYSPYADPSFSLFSPNIKTVSLLVVSRYGTHPLFLVCISSFLSYSHFFSTMFTAITFCPCYCFLAYVWFFCVLCLWYFMLPRLRKVGRRWMGANVSVRLVYVLDEVKLVGKLSIVSSLLKKKF